MPRSDDGTFLLHPERAESFTGFDPARLDRLYAHEQSHFWFLTRKRAILEAFRAIIPFGARLIEIGAGTGDVSRELMRAGYRNIAAGEIHLNGLQYAAQYGIERRFQFDIHERAFVDEFDAVGMFDVVEHFADDAHVIANVNAMLRPGGWLALTVPAHQWLWSQHDVDAGHHRRYTARALDEMLVAGGFRILYRRSLFSLLLPLFWLRHLRQPGSDRIVRRLDSEDMNAEFRIPPAVNRLLLVACRIDRLLQRVIRLPFAGSWLVIAQKVETGRGARV